MCIRDRYLAWMSIVVYAVGLSFYVCLFAVKAGRATSVQWMISFWVAFVEVRWCATNTRTHSDFLLPRDTALVTCFEPCAQVLFTFLMRLSLLSPLLLLVATVVA